MADKYALQQQGVADGTKNPPEKADGREVNANRTCLVASKSTADAWNVADRVFLGRKKAGDKVVGIRATTGTSFATSTLSIGDGVTADKYCAAKTLTAVDTPTYLGPKASTLDDTPDILPWANR